MDFEIFILLVLLSTHLLAFWTGWAIRDLNDRENARSGMSRSDQQPHRPAFFKLKPR